MIRKQHIVFFLYRPPTSPGRFRPWAVVEDVNRENINELETHGRFLKNRFAKSDYLINFNQCPSGNSRFWFLARPAHF